MAKHARVSQHFEHVFDFDQSVAQPPVLLPASQISGAMLLQCTGLAVPLQIWLDGLHGGHVSAATGRKATQMLPTTSSKAKARDMVRTTRRIVRYVTWCSCRGGRKGIHCGSEKRQNYQSTAGSVLFFGGAFRSRKDVARRFAPNRPDPAALWEGNESTARGLREGSGEGNNRRKGVGGKEGEKETIRKLTIPPLFMGRLLLVLEIFRRPQRKGNVDCRLARSGDPFSCDLRFKFSPFPSRISSIRCPPLLQVHVAAAAAAA